MLDFGIYAGDTDKTIYVRLRDSTTGLAKTGLVYNSTGAVCSYTLPAAARAAITLATQTVTGAHSDGGFVEVDATNCKGLYRLDLPDAAIASGAFTLISIEFDGIIEETVAIPLHTRQVNVTQWLGTAAATPTTAGVPEVDVTYWLGTAAATPTVAGVPEVDVTHWLGTAAATPDTAGIPMVNVEEVGGTTQTAGDIIGSLPTEADNNGILLIDTVTSISSDTVTLTSPGVTTDDQFNDCVIVIKDVSTNENWSGYVVDSVASSDTLVLNENPATAVGWTPASTDLVRVYPKTKADFEIGAAVNATISADIAAVKTETASILADTATLGTPAGADFAADIAAVKTDTGNIVTDTNELQTDWVNGGRLDLLLDATLADTNELQTDLTDGGRLDLLIDAIKVVTDLLADSAATIVHGTVDTVTNTHTPTTTEFQADDITEATADHYKDRLIVFTSGALQNQYKNITGYSLVGGIGQFTTAAFTEAPANNDTFIII